MLRKKKRLTDNIFGHSLFVLILHYLFFYFFLPIHFFIYCKEETLTWQDIALPQNYISTASLSLFGHVLHSHPQWLKMKCGHVINLVHSFIFGHFSMFFIFQIHFTFQRRSPSQYATHPLTSSNTSALAYTQSTPLMGKGSHKVSIFQYFNFNFRLLKSF